MRSSIRARVVVAIVAPTIASGAAANSQEVSGLARVSGSSVPIGGASIVLVDQSGVTVTGTLSQADGRYSLRLPSAGRFRLRARRIGFAPDSSPILDFASTSRLQYDPVMPALRTTLEVVKVEGIQKCEVGHESGDAAFELWEAAQNALAATIAAAGDRQLVYRLGRFLREVEPDSARGMPASSRRGGAV